MAFGPTGVRMLQKGCLAMSDLVERLRDVAGFIEKEHGRVAAAACLATEAAARIQQLEAALRAVDDEHGYGLPPETRQMIRAALGVPWKCPINDPDCKSNCGSYGCGN